MQTQICNKCYKDKPLSEFAPRTDFCITLNCFRTSYNKICRTCTAEHKKAWRMLNPDYHNNYDKARKDDPVKRICVSCGREFETRTPKQVLCHHNCKGLTYKEEYIAWRKQYPGVNRDVFLRMRNQREQQKLIDSLK